MSPWESRRLGKLLKWLTVAPLISALGCHDPLKSLLCPRRETCGLVRCVEARGEMEEIKITAEPGGLIAAHPKEIAEQLNEGAVIAEVLKSNPTVEAATAAWWAAVEQVPQATSLADPELRLLGGAYLGGSSFFNALVNDLDASQFRWQYRQKLPWPGKRDLRGAVATARSEASAQDIHVVQCHLIEATRQAYADYWLAHRQCALLAWEETLTQEYGLLMKSFVERGMVPPPMLHKLELARLEGERRHSELELAVKLAQARLNLLLHREPDGCLPPPMDMPPLPITEDIAEARRAALANHPEYLAEQARLRADEATISLAQREFYPDIDVVARVDNIWQDNVTFVRPLVGIHVDLPIRREKRHAALRQAQANRSRRCAEMEHLAARIQHDIQIAYDRLQAIRRRLQTYPALLAISSASISELEAERKERPDCLIAWYEAHRQLLRYQSQQLEELRELHHVLATLERSVGASKTHLTEDP